MAGNEYTPDLLDDPHDQENGHPADSGATHTTIQVDDPQDQENGHSVDSGATHTTIQVDDSHDQENGHPVDSGVTHTTTQSTHLHPSQQPSSHQFSNHCCRNSHKLSSPALSAHQQPLSQPNNSLSSAATAVKTATSPAILESPSQHSKPAALAFKHCCHSSHLHQSQQPPVQQPLLSKQPQAQQPCTLSAPAAPVAAQQQPKLSSHCCQNSHQPSNPGQPLAQHSKPAALAFKHCCHSSHLHPSQQPSSHQFSNHCCRNSHKPRSPALPAHKQPLSQPNNSLSSAATAVKTATSPAILESPSQHSKPAALAFKHCCHSSHLHQSQQPPVQQPLAPQPLTQQLCTPSAPVAPVAAQQQPRFSSHCCQNSHQSSKPAALAFKHCCSSSHLHLSQQPLTQQPCIPSAPATPVAAQQQPKFSSHCCQNSHQPSNPAQPLAAQRTSSPSLQALLSQQPPASVTATAVETAINPAALHSQHTSKPAALVAAQQQPKFSSHCCQNSHHSSNPAQPLAAQ
ncbi:hypothetical protein Acr_08g0016730 [Actinidia rufa]|uniref:Uncharacterized protein n=1 Tax=Actinidia rufa TaxID=165716 RepID=A0A7J0F5R7_9ERIC|nr:hypothetical protein Acr_08g0016730 [Actinidia rufa]